jgi:predicted nucleic acid-binding protein
VTSWIVIDSGVLIASAVEETYTRQADALLAWIRSQPLTMAAPTLLRYEVTATLRKLAHRGSIAAPDGERLLRQLLKTPIDLMLDDALIERAYALATDHGLPSAYDAQYLAVAERLGCALWTFDKRLFNTVHERLSWVNYVVNFETPAT